jgi:hypothetical protein
MTASTTTTTGVARDHVRFPQSARMEWIKLCSLRSTWWVLALTVAGAAAIAVAVGVNTEDAAADSSAGCRSGPDDVPTQAAAVRTSSTARPTPVQSCHRRRRGSGSARWRGSRLMSAPKSGWSGRGRQLRKLDDFIRSLPLVTPAARW